MADEFGGVTAYTRAPAEGLWRTGQRLDRDDIVTFEVMAPTINRRFWTKWRRELAKQFGQQEIIVRGWPIKQL